MSKLQSNFTTPEQSKRLLELGVPAWTADCYYEESGKIEIKNTALDTLYPSCWSVGRLIEIAKICSVNKYDIIGLFQFLEDCEDCLLQLIDYLEKMIYYIDFSKLEE